MTCRFVIGLRGVRDAEKFLNEVLGIAVISLVAVRLRVVMICSGGSGVSVYIGTWWPWSQFINNVSMNPELSTSQFPGAISEFWDGIVLSFYLTAEPSLTARTPSCIFS